MNDRMSKRQIREIRKCSHIETTLEYQLLQALEAEKKYSRKLDLQFIELDTTLERCDRYTTMVPMPLSNPRELIELDVVLWSDVKKALLIRLS